MKRQIFIGVMTLMATGVFAQPPEEVPPPPPDQGTVEQAPAPQPVAEPKPAAAPQSSAAAPEDPRLKGVVLSPSVNVLPIGYDSIDIGGAEGGRYYFALSPAINLSTAFKTDHDRKLDFTAGYAFRWREYYNKATTNRDITNDFMGSMSMAWNPILSTSVDGLFEYFFKSGADTNADNNIYIEVNPTMKFTVSDQLSFKVGYQLAYLALIDSKIGPNGINTNTDPPSDPGDLGRGYFGSDVTGFDNFGNVIDAQKETETMAQNRAVLGTSFSPIKGTSLGFTYKYEFYTTSNNDGNKLTAHFIVPTISQELPWKGGSVSLTDEIRLRKYKYALADDQDPANSPLKQTFRNRITLDVSQAILGTPMVFVAYYRLESGGKNADDYARIDNNHQFYMGVSFGF